MNRDYDSVDYFLDEELIVDPQPYYEYARSKCPVYREPHHGVVMVTGYDEASEIFAAAESFSSCISPGGPFPGFPVPARGRDDVSELIDKHRHELPLSKEIMTMDPPRHTEHRALMRRQITPKRISETEQEMVRFADVEIDSFIGDGAFDLVGQFAAPFALVNICALMGVPEEDWPEFRVEMLGEHRDRGLGNVKQEFPKDPFAFLRDRFTRYISDRRSHPRADIMTGMATAPFPDGATPSVEDVVRIASALFIGGSGTTAHLLGSAFVRLGEDQKLQQRLRAQPGLIPNFVEEMLRLEGPVKATFRLSREQSTIGGVDIDAGSTVMLVCAAAGRDAGHFAHPHDLDIDRENVRHHRAFGHGPHTCPGAPLARSEARVAIERLLARLDRIEIDETFHGPAGARRFDYVPTYQLRGLQNLHLTFTAAE